MIEPRQRSLAAHAQRAAVEWIRGVAFQLDRTSVADFCQDTAASRTFPAGRAHGIRFAGQQLGCGELGDQLARDLLVAGGRQGGAGAGAEDSKKISPVHCK